MGGSVAEPRDVQEFPGSGRPVGSDQVRGGVWIYAPFGSSSAGLLLLLVVNIDITALCCEAVSSVKTSNGRSSKYPRVEGNLPGETGGNFPGELPGRALDPRSAYHLWPGFGPGPTGSPRSFPHGRFWNYKAVLKLLHTYTYIDIHIYIYIYNIYPYKYLYIYIHI